MNSDMHSNRSTGITRYFIGAAFCWSVVLLALFFWGSYQEHHNTLTVARKEARAHFNKDYAFRLWATSHGGVYVPTDERTPPNPFLVHIPERDIQTPSGRRLTLMNPAYMLRQLMREYEDLYKVKGRITSLNPLNTNNAPDEWERSTLEQFEKGAEEISEIVTRDGVPYLRLMKPMRTDAACLKCHASQGYREGDVRGGVGIAVPLQELFAEKRQHVWRWGLSLVCVWLAGIAGLTLGGKKILKQVRDSERVTCELQEQKNETLRHKVRFEAIFNSFADGIVFADMGRRIRMINQGFTSLLGYSFDEVEGQQARMLSNNAEEFDLQGAERFNKNTPVKQPYFEVEFKRKNGSVFLSEALAVKVVGLNGEVVGFLWIIRDITERDADRQKVRANNERLEVMLQLNEMFGATDDEIVQYGLDCSVFLSSSKTGFFHFISDDQENIKLSHWAKDVWENCRMPEETEYPLAEAGSWADCIRMGRTVIHNDYQDEPGDRGYPEGHPPVVRHMSIPLFDREKMIAVLGVGNKEKPYTEFDAKQVTILAQNFVRLLIRKREEREKEALQARLQQAYKMEAVGTLAGGIAHDFNNIIGIIHGNADMALDDVPQDNPARKSVGRILDAAERARNIVKQILVFSRQADMKLQPVQPCQLVKETLSLLRATVPTTVRIDEQLGASGHAVMADSSQFQQLLMNLFVNGIHAMNEKGTMTLTTDLVNLQATEIFPDEHFSPGPCFSLSIADTGAGMDEVTMNRMFEPFYTTKDASEGTGMGLSIVKGIVDNHGGLIRADSKPGEGTTFRIYFPLVEDQTVSPQVKTTEVVHGTERIMFVDDEEMITEMGAVMLRRLGYTVEAVSSSTRALEVFRADPDAFDLIITDQTMPNLSGSELSAELLKIRPGIPIILCTGFSKQINRRQVRELGIREFLFKPLDKQILSSAIRRVLAG